MPAPETKYRGQRDGKYTEEAEYGNGHMINGDPSKGGRPRSTPEGGMRVQQDERRDARAAIMEETRARLRERSSLTLTPEIAASIVQLVKDGNYPAVAAKSLGVSEGTFKSWLQRGEAMATDFEPSVHDPEGLQAELWLAVEEAEGTFEVGIVQIMKERIEANKNWTGHMTLLERRFPERWGKRDTGGVTPESWEAQLRAYTMGADAERARA